jgi:hypothetical protein
MDEFGRPTLKDLKLLKADRQNALDQFNILDNKLAEICFHPVSERFTLRIDYYIDTLGENSVFEYQDKCGCCDIDLDYPYDLEKDSENLQPNYYLRFQRLPKRNEF